MDRREFVKLMVACAIVGTGTIGWDSGVNGGKPAEETGGEEEPPN